MLRFLVPALGLAALYYVWRHPDGWAGLTKLVRPVLLLMAALLYLRAPIDVIPDGTLIGFLDDLLVLLAALYFGRSTPSAAPPPPPVRPARTVVDFDPYGVLGVAPNASQIEIARAFRDKMKQYHPDRVSGLGDELQKVAHEKSIEIRRAYDALKKK